MIELKKFIRDINAEAVVEATILFPIMIMIFAGLVLLSMYLPTRATLQRATQYAATALATENSDTWLFFDENSMTYYWSADKSELDSVYVTVIKSFLSNYDEDKAEKIVREVEKNSVSSKAGDLEVNSKLVNYIIYKEIIVTATRTIPVPVDLSFVGFPKEIPIIVTSSAVVQDGDEFVRNMDIAVDLAEYADNKYNISETFSGVKEFFVKFKDFIGL